MRRQLTELSQSASREPGETQTAPIGTWTAKADGLKLEFSADATFTVTLAGTTVKSISGKYVVQEDTITFRNAADALRCPEEPGRYRWWVDDNGGLHLELLDDSCESRISHLQTVFASLKHD